MPMFAMMIWLFYSDGVEQIRLDYNSMADCEEMLHRAPAFMAAQLDAGGALAWCGPRQ